MNRSSAQALRTIGILDGADADIANTNMPLQVADIESAPGLVLEHGDSGTILQDVQQQIWMQEPHLDNHSPSGVGFAGIPGMAHEGITQDSLAPSQAAGAPPPLERALRWAIESMFVVYGPQETIEFMNSAFQCAVVRSQLFMQQFATVPTIDPSYHLPPPYAEVLQPEAHPSPAASRTGNVTVTSGCAIAFDTVALHREVRPVACRLGGDCNLVFTGVESATTIRQHLQMAHGIEVRAQGLTQLVRCAWVGEDGTACPATIRTSGMAKHLREVHLHIGAVWCALCERWLEREDAYRRHLLRFHGLSA